jgi:hypothetical protein
MPGMHRRLLAPLLFLLLLPALAAAQQPPQLIIQAPASLKRAADQVRSVDPERLLDAMRLVGLTDPGPPIQVLLGPEGSDLAMVPPWVSGYAFGEEGVIVLLPARAPSYPDSSLEELLRHEVAHVLVARAAGGRPLPRWFHEGLAMIAGLSWGLDDRSQLTLTLVGDGEVSLERLEEELRGGGPGEVRGAYAIAGAFANDLLRRYGDDTAARILAGVARGLSFEDAFKSATGATLGEAERAFWRRQTLWYRWVPLLTSSVTLWLLITLLAIWAMGKRRARDAALRRKWEEEEERRLAEILAQDPDEPVN